MKWFLVSCFFISNFKQILIWNHNYCETELENFEESIKTYERLINIDKNEFPQVKWVYDYRNDHDDPIFKKEDGTIDEEARDKKYREEAKDGDEIKGWLLKTRWKLNKNSLDTK